MQKKTIRKVSGAAIVALFISVCAIFVFQIVFKDTDRSLLANSVMGSPFTLVDHKGKPITETALTGSPAAVFFGFTHCPEVCPTTLYELSGWLESLGSDGENINAFFFTVDPSRDTPDVMNSYVENFSDRIVGITGDPKKMSELAKSWHVYWNKVPLDDGGYTMDHTASVFLIDSKGGFRGTIAFRESTDTALEKLRRLAKN